VSIVAAMAIGLAGGAVAGLMGVGGGILFVPALTIVLGHSQVVGEATSLVAIVPVALVGTWRQRGYGNVRLGDGILIGLLSVAGVGAGTVIANELSQRALEVLFALLILFVAYRLIVRALSQGPGTIELD
jgi:uncharacterized membrane protein YfcA